LDGYFGLLTAVGGSLASARCIRCKSACSVSMAAAVTRPAQSRCPPATWSDVNLHHAEDAEEGPKSSTPITVASAPPRPPSPPSPSVTSPRQSERAPESPHRPTTIAHSHPLTPRRPHAACLAVMRRRHACLDPRLLPKVSCPPLALPGIPHQQSTISNHPSPHITPHPHPTTILYLISAASIVPRPSRVSGPRPALVRGGGDANTLHPIHPVHPITQSTPSPNHPINPSTQSPNRPQPRRGRLGLTSLPQRALVYCELRRPLSLCPASMPP
jgi:hypothetical protein